MPGNLNQSVGTLFYAQSTNRYLFLLRAMGSHENTWGFVGGKVDPGESVYQALIREISEEISVDAANIKHIPVEKYTSLKNRFEFYTYCSIVENEFIPVLNAEHAGYAWTPINNYPKPLHPGVYNSFNVTEIINKFSTIESVWR